MKSNQIDQETQESGGLACHLCSVTFTQKCNLNKHLFQKHGEYPYNCNVCDFKDLVRSKLDEHMFKEHGISKYKGRDK